MDYDYVITGLEFFTPNLHSPNDATVNAFFDWILELPAERQAEVYDFFGQVGQLVPYKENEIITELGDIAKRQAALRSSLDAIFERGMGQRPQGIPPWTPPTTPGRVPITIPQDPFVEEVAQTLAKPGAGAGAALAWLPLLLSLVDDIIAVQAAKTETVKKPQQPEMVEVTVDIMTIYYGEYMEFGFTQADNVHNQGHPFIRPAIDMHLNGIYALGGQILI